MCAGQVRVLGTRIIGLDIGALLAIGAARGADAEFLADAALAIEPIIMRFLNELTEE